MPHATRFSTTVQADCYDLAPRTVLPVLGQAGRTMRVLRGRVWVTEEGDLRDLFLAAGDEYAIEGEGMVLVEGLSIARVSIEAPQAPRGWTEWVRTALKAVTPCSGPRLRLHGAPLGAD